MSETNTIGTRVRNKDALDKVTGGRHFPVNVKLPGMLHGKLVRSPYAHAKVLNVDTSEALSLPGVKAVVTSKDLPSVKNPYGEGNATEKIMRILLNAEIPSEPIKEFYDL